MWDVDMAGFVFVYGNRVNGYDDTVIVVFVISEGRVNWGSVVLLIVSLRYCLVGWGGWWE